MSERKYGYTCEELAQKLGLSERTIGTLYSHEIRDLFEKRQEGINKTVANILQDNLKAHENQDYINRGFQDQIKQLLQRIITLENK